MPLDIPMPWLRPADVVSEAASGSRAGAEAARIEQNAVLESQRLGQEAFQNNQRLNLEAQKLTQQERMANMEMQARQQIAEQQRLREQQRMAQQQAYHEAQIGMAKGRLEEQKMINDQKAQEAAMRFKREQDFARDLSAGMSVQDAYRKNPVSASVINALTKKQDVEKPRFFNSKGTIVKVNPDGSTTEVYTPKQSGGDILGAAAGPDTAPPAPGVLDRVKRFFGGTPSAPAAAPAADARVKVKSPEGKVGTIPAAQLDDAIAAGYTRVE